MTRLIATCASCGDTTHAKRPTGNPNEWVCKQTGKCAQRARSRPRKLQKLGS